MARHGIILFFPFGMPNKYFVVTFTLKRLWKGSSAKKMRISWSRFLKESLLWPRVSRMLFIINQAGFFEHVSSTCAPLKPTNKKSRSHALTPFLPKSDKHTITPNSTDPESNVKVGRIAETITNLRSFDCWTNSLRQYQRKWTEKSMENLHTDVTV